MNIKDLVQEAYQTAKDKGWHDKPATFGDRIALCHSELSEALEAYRTLDNSSYDALRQPVYSRDGRMTRDAWHYAGFEKPMLPNKPEGVRSELADVVIRIADMCGLYGIDLEGAILEKLVYNKTRPYRHGGKQL